MNVTVVQIVIGGHGTVQKKMERKLEEVVITENPTNLDQSFAKILSKVLKIGGGLLSLRLERKKNRS